MACVSGVGFNPLIDGERHLFHAYAVYNGVMAMRDEQTGSIWSHYDGKVLAGSLAQCDLQLQPLPLHHMTWREWKTLHPETLVLDRYKEHRTMYERTMNRPMATSRMMNSSVDKHPELSSLFTETLLHVDDRLPQTEVVLGVNIDDTYRAYVLAEFEPGLLVEHDILAETPVVLFIDNTQPYGAVFIACLDGIALTFRQEDDQILDNRGNHWDLEGKAASGPDSGQRLQRVSHLLTYWYAWVAHHPQTTIAGVDA